MPGILGLAALLIAPSLGMVAQTVPDQGFFEDSAVSLEVKTFALAVDPLAEKENGYVAWQPDSGRAVIIDPGAPSQEILEFIRGRRLKALAVLNTHGHADHCAGNCFLAARLSLPVYLERADRAIVSQVPGAACSLTPYPDGGLLVLDGWEIEVIRTPGHTPGSVCLKIGDVLFSGDTLFAGAVGKAEGLAGLRLEVRNIRRFLLVLPPSTRVFPGHGAATTIGAEKAFNPYLVQ